MFSRLTSLALISLPLMLGCDRDKTSVETEPEAVVDPASTTSPGTVTSTPATIDPRLAGPIVLSKAVPADAAVVATMRAPEGIFKAATQLHWLGPRDSEQDQALHAEIDTFLIEQIGVKLSSAHTVTVFYSEEPQRFGLILDGIEGDLTGTEKGRHKDTVLREFAGNSDLIGASHGSMLLLSDVPGLESMLDALDGSAPALVDSSEGIAALLASESAGARLAVVAEAASLPSDFSQPANEVGVERAYFGVSNTGARVVAHGDPAKISAAASIAKAGIARGLSELEKMKVDALGSKQVFEGLGAITALHTAKRFAVMLEPKVEGGLMTIEVPLAIGDIGPLVALAGAGAAVAIPAMTKYMRRAKTAEAKVQLAKLYDAASAYFMDEQIARGALDPTMAVTLHKCPNDGRASGEAGVTPPLSVNCNDGPGGRCVPLSGSKFENGYYDINLWNDNPVWEGLNFVQEQAHYFHYNFVWTNSESDYGACVFTIQAFADLDDDGVFSTYERSGSGDKFGVNSALGLYVDQEVE